MGLQRTIGALLAVLGLGVSIYSRTIRAEHFSVPPSKEEVAAQQKRRKTFAIGAIISLFGLLVLLVP